MKDFERSDTRFIPMDVPDHLQEVVWSVTDALPDIVLPKNGYHSTSWEQGNIQNTFTGYDKLAVHLADDALILYHLHHIGSGYSRVDAPREYERVSLVIERGQATVFNGDHTRVGPQEVITDNPEQGRAFTHRIRQAFGRLGLDWYQAVQERAA